MAERPNSDEAKKIERDRKTREGADEREVRRDPRTQRRSSHHLPSSQINASLSANEESDSEREKKRQRAMNAIESRKKRARRKAFVGNLESQYKQLAAEKEVLLRQSLLLQSALSEATRIARLVDLEVASNRVAPSVNSFGFQLGSSGELLLNGVYDRPLSTVATGFEPAEYQPRITRMDLLGHAHMISVIRSANLDNVNGAGNASYFLQQLYASQYPSIRLNNLRDHSRLLWPRPQGPLSAPGIQGATQADRLSIEREIQRLLHALQALQR